MSRPKGSKNRSKESTGIPPIESIREAKVPEAKPWKPEPEMGEIKPPKETEKLCICEHKKEMHYGPKTDWCNTRGCQCQRFECK